MIYIFPNLRETLQSNDTSVEIWVDSISLQPFTEEEWKSHQDQSIAKVSLIIEGLSMMIYVVSIGFLLKETNYIFVCRFVWEI